MLFRIILLNRINFNPVSLIHWDSSISTQNGIVYLGYRCRVCKNVEIMADGGEIRIGKYCFVNRNTMICSHDKITIEEGTTIGPNVCIYDHDHDKEKKFISEPIMIGKNVWIGANVTILKGVHIGDSAVIGAGAVVTKDVPANSTVGGVPARVLLV